MVAEDEEGCLKEYKVNGLIDTSANLECDSPVHNNDTSSQLKSPSNTDYCSP